MENAKDIVLARLGGGLLAAVLCLSAGLADAATQGTLGATSTGVVNISATITNKAQITGLTDLVFNALDGVNTAQLTENVCVWSNTPTKSYSIKATGNGTGGAFTLINSGGALIPYAVAWSNASGATTGASLATGAASSTLTTTAASPTCATGAASTATLLVSIAAADQQTMVGGANYAGALTLLVTPQ